MSPKLSLTALLLISLTLAMISPALSETPSIPFPMVIEDNSAPGFRLRPVLNDLERLSGLRNVRLVDLLLPDGSMVDLILTRVPVPLPEEIAIDGEVDNNALSDFDLTLWKGSVSGVDSSEVFLAFSRMGSHGWIATEDIFHLIATPSDGGDWSQSTSILSSESELRERGQSLEFECGTDKIVQPRIGDALKKHADGEAWAPRLRAGSPLPLYRCRLVVETDTQFYDLFGDFNAARNYALALLGALSDRFREQFGTLLTIRRLGLYPFGDDPWTSQDTGGSSGDLLNEFRNEWSNGGAPTTGDLYHFVSGANLGGGVAYLDVLCNQSFGFAVSGNLHGRTPLPPIPGHNLNWDFFVIAHELGHNFGSPHTHSYSPPIDQCASGQCITNGTIMSYCHGCSGGMTNITTYFHPRVIDVIRPLVEMSCLPLFRGIFPTDVGYALAGSNGTPQLEVSFSSNPDALSFAIESAPEFRTGYLIASTNSSYRSFRGDPAGTLVPRLDGFVRPIPTGPTGDLTLTREISQFSFPAGQFVWAQLWVRDPQGPHGWAATNGVEFELIQP